MTHLAPSATRRASALAVAGALALGGPQVYALAMSHRAPRTPAVAKGLAGIERRMTVNPGAQLAADNTLSLHPHGSTAAPSIATPWPPAGHAIVADSAQAYVAARIDASAPIMRVELRLDGTVVTPEVLGRDDAAESLFYQPRRWSVGRHAVRVTVWDAARRVGRRTWSFRITPPATHPAGGVAGDVERRQG